MDDLTTYIKSYFPVAPAELGAIAQRFKPVHLPKNDFFLKAGHSCKELAFIRSGVLRIYRNAGDKEITQWIATTGHFVTDLASFVFNTPGRWQIQALGDCELYVIDQKDYTELNHAIPQWAELDKLFIARCFVLLEERIFNHLHLSAEERFKQLINDHPALFNLVPLQYLASMLGMTPETLSRLRNKFVH